MRRLYLQIYLTVVATLVLFSILASVAWWMGPSRDSRARLFEGLGNVLAEILPPADRPREELQAAVERLGKTFSSRVTIRAGDGALLAAFGEPLPLRDFHRRRGRSGFVRRGRAALALPDGRWVIVEHPFDSRGHLLVLALFLGAVAAGAYPVVRGVTRRLERLKSRVEELGAGELSARVVVEGNDEIASLARSFNQAAERIEKLVSAQRSVLASASHELRSPLARLRVAFELLGAERRPELARSIEKDIRELDGLIDELLLASRLEAVPAGSDAREEVDLLALVAEEAARAGVAVRGEPVLVPGDPRLLRRLVRNLVENAVRYAGGSTVEAIAAPSGDGGARFTVLDRGPGVPAGERERIFEPFYRPPGFPKTADGGGIGLGLALVRQIARRHGGDVRCLPRESGGTAFEVTLPGER